jgi:hypothetical protein
MKSPLSALGKIAYQAAGLGGHTIPLTLSLEVDFEGFYGRASEDMEYQWVLDYQDIIYKSRRYEDLDTFITRIALDLGINLFR